MAKQTRWIDLSAYDLKLAIVKMKTGKNILVLRGEGNSLPAVADVLGFMKHERSGFWVKNGTKFDLGEFYRNLKSAGFDKVGAATVDVDDIIVDLSQNKPERQPVKEEQQVEEPADTTASPADATADTAAEDAGEDASESAHEAEHGTNDTHSRREAERAAAEAARREREQERARAEQEERDLRERIKRLVAQAHFVGLNNLGQKVQEAEGERFIQDDRERVVFESEMSGASPATFLHAPDDQALAGCADGFVKEMDRGNILRIGDLNRFVRVVFGENVEKGDPRFAKAYTAIESAMARALVRDGGKSMREVFQSALKLHEAHAFFADVARDKTIQTMPLPVSVVAQRLLGTEADLEGKSLTVAGAGSGALLSHISRKAQVRAFERDSALLDQARATAQAAGHRRPGTISSDEPDYGADLIIANLTGQAGQPLDDAVQIEDGPSVSRSDLLEMLNALGERNDDGRSIFILPYGDAPEDQEEFEAVREFIGRHYGVEGTAEIDGSLFSGSAEAAPTRMLVVGQRRPEPLPKAPEPALRVRNIYDYPNLWTWTAEVVTARAKIADYHASEAARGEAEADEDLDENPFQTPYTPASRLGSASTMVPRNLDGPTREAQAKLARRHPDIDQWVANELAMTKEQVSEVLSPEQIDAFAMQMGAEERGRGFLIADQTGIGKGRTIAAIMRRAAMQGKKVLFVTERKVNLSDIWRDIKHIRSDAEFAPLIVNGSTQIIDEATGEVTMESLPKAEIDAIMRSGEWPDEYNLAIATYSQFNRPSHAGLAEKERRDEEERQRRAERNGNRRRGGGRRRRGEPPRTSDKSNWLTEAIDEDTVVILDESHNGSSGVSNTSINFQLALRNAGSVVFSSATFAKNAKNMGFYQRLFPEGMNADELTEIMRKGGETMQEVVSTMLAKDGVMIRREHDLSRCDFESTLDEEHMDRNRASMDALAEVLSEMAYLSGDIGKRVERINEQIARENGLRQGERPDRRIKSLQLNKMSFGSPLYNLSRLFLTSLKVEKAADLAIQALRENRKPVILVENTVQTVLQELAAQQQVDDEPVTPDFKSLMHRALRQLTTVTRRRNGVVERVDVFENDSIADDQYCGALEAAMAALPGASDETNDAADIMPENFKEVLEEAVGAYALAARRECEETREVQGLNEGVQRMRVLLDGLADDPEQALASLRAAVAAMPRTMRRYVRQIETMIDRLPDLPASGIDAVRDLIEGKGQELYEAGEIERPWRIDEITGRTMECRDGQIVARPREEKTIVKNRFNAGVSDGVIINGAGATGIDLHAGARFDDQRQREMIIMQSISDITRLIQAFGRVNRFDQVVGPVINTILSGLPMEMRLDAMTNAKLRRLSANTTSNRDNAAVIKNIPDLMNAVGDIVCTRYGDARPDLMRRLGFEIDRNENVENQNAANEENMGEDERDNKRSANLFLARLLMLPTDQQEQVIGELIAEFDATIEEMDAMGINPLRSKEMDGIIHEEKREIFEGADVETPQSVFQEPVYLLDVDVEHDQEPIRPDVVFSEVERGLQKLGAETPQVLAERLNRGRERILKQFLPPNIATVQAAIDANVGHVVKAAERLDQLTAILQDLEPGAKIRFTDGDDTVIDGVVTRINTPMRGYEHINAAYDIEILVPGEIFPRVRTLSTLSKDENLALSAGLNDATGEEYDQLIDAFEQAATGSRMEKRRILSGNLFKAMQLNVNHKLGTLNVYSRDDGTHNRGVVVSKKNMHLDFLPVTLETPEIATDALQQAEGIILRGEKDLSSANLHILRDDRGRYVFTLPHHRSKKWQHIYEHPGVLAMLEERVNRKKTEKPKIVYNDIASVRAAINALHAAGVKFYASGRFRSWSNEWQARNAAETNDAEQNNRRGYAA